MTDYVDHFSKILNCDDKVKRSFIPFASQLLKQELLNLIPHLLLYILIPVPRIPLNHKCLHIPVICLCLCDIRIPEQEPLRLFENLQGVTDRP